MEGFFVLESENNVVEGQSKIAKDVRDSLGIAARKKLNDISNLSQRPKPLNLDKKPQGMSSSGNNYIDQLKKENMTLAKLVTERNKIIELSGIELQKLRINLQKMQQQNLQLAQSNSQMLAELNSGKDRLKALHHELGCKNGLLIAKKVELEENAKARECQRNDNEVRITKCDKAEKSSKTERDNDRQHKTNMRQQSKSLDPSTNKEKAEKKRPCVRRQSARFKSEELKPSEGLFEVNDDRLPLSSSADDQKKRQCIRRQSARLKSEEPNPSEGLFEVDDARFPICSSADDDQKQKDISASVCLSVKTEDEDGDPEPRYEAQGFSRPSIGRPSRQATKRVQSYKEIPLNVKMRRT